MKWSFAVAAVLCVAVLGLVAMLPSRIADPEADHAGPADENAGEPVATGEPV